MSRYVLLALACLPFLAAPALAHEVRPGYLELKQTGEENYDVLWKVPAVGDELRLGIFVRFYLQALGDGLNFYVTYIPEDFTVEAKESFDVEYMRALFEFGSERGRTDTGWQAAPPGYEGKEDFKVEESEQWL